MILEGKTALVTGAGQGLGRGIAQAYAKYGARVLIADINDEPGRETVRLIEAAGGEAAFVHTDVASPESCREMVAAAVAFGGRLDIACNNAGVVPPPAPLHETTDEAWKRVISVNLDGVFYCARAEIVAMLETGGGVIANISSIMGAAGFAGVTPYTAAKHGVAGLSKQIAVEYAAQQIRAFAIAPGFIKTGLESMLDADTQASLAGLHPAGRMGEISEIGEVVAFLSSDGASFVNGAYIPVDGGYLSR